MNCIKHLKKILTHKYYVFIASLVFKIPYRGIMHDLSKFHWIEFFESVKYYTGNGSPIDRSKKENGYSECWMHHKGSNPHHWEYWIDYTEGKLIAVKMPFDRVMEMVCDYCGAGKAYEGRVWTIESPLNRWESVRDGYLIHKDTRELLDYVFYNYSKLGSCIFDYIDYDRMKHVYINGGDFIV